MSDRVSLRQVAALMAYAGDHGWLPAAVQTRRCGGVAMVRSPSGSPAFCSTGNFFVAIILYAALTVL
jgi:hypothetical protein